MQAPSPRVNVIMKLSRTSLSHLGHTQPRNVIRGVVTSTSDQLCDHTLPTHTSPIANIYFVQLSVSKDFLRSVDEKSCIYRYLFWQFLLCKFLKASNERPIKDVVVAFLET